MEKNDIYKTISKTSDGSFKDRGSKFIAYAFPVSSVEEIKQRQDEVRNMHHDARHHCYAYRLGLNGEDYRINDDGEPSSSAGKPIHGQLLSYQITNVLVIVVRYFGGTKLGVPGLINAYRSSTKEALESNKIITKTLNDFYEIKYNYPIMNDVMKIIKDEKLNQISTCFELDCKIEFSVRQSDSERISEKFKKLKSLEIKFLRTN